MKTIKGGAFTGTGTAASYTVPTVRQSAYRVRSPAFHRETLFLRSLCSIKKPAEGAETGNKRVLSVSVSLSLSLSSKILSSLLSQILKSPRAPSRITNNSLFPVSFRPFLQFLSRKKKNKRREKKNQAIMRGGRSIRFLRSHAFLRLFHYTITQLPMFYRSRIPQSGYYFFH